MLTTLVNAMATGDTPRCMPWCTELCSELTGDVGRECGGCSGDEHKCRPAEATLRTATTAGAVECSPWCSELCSELSGDVVRECGGCFGDEYKCRPGLPGFGGAEGAKPVRTSRFLADPPGGLAWGGGPSELQPLADGVSAAASVSFTAIGERQRLFHVDRGLKVLVDDSGLAWTPAPRVASADARFIGRVASADINPHDSHESQHELSQLNEHLGDVLYQTFVLTNCGFRVPMWPLAYTTRLQRRDGRAKLDVNDAELVQQDHNESEAEFSGSYAQWHRDCESSPREGQIAISRGGEVPHGEGCDWREMSRTTEQLTVLRYVHPEWPQEWGSPLELASPAVRATDVTGGTDVTDVGPSLRTWITSSIM